MAKQEIREFGDFTGENNQGYIIVGGKTADIEGGKKLLSDVIPSVPQADEETITNDNGELKVTNPIPDFTNHHDSILCVDEYNNNNNLIWSDDRSDSFNAYDVYRAILTSRKYNDEDNHDYPLYLNSSGGLSMHASENEGDVLTTTEKGIEWKQPSAQLQADWAQNDNTQKDYIKNKPDISNKIESISIADTEIVPDENKNVNIGLGKWLNIDSDNKLNVIPDYGGGTGGLKYDNSNGDLSVMFDRKTIVRDVDNNLSVADPLPSKSNENYRKILLLNEDKDAVWSDNISFGSGSEEGGNKYITPKIPVAIPKDFSYSESDQHGYPNDYEINWQDATPPAPNPGFAYSDAPIGTKKSFNLISTVQNINEGFYNTREYDYDWEETQTIPDPKTGSHNGHVLTYDSSEGIVWAAPTCLTKAEADTYYAPKSEFDNLVAWLAPISANLVIAASNN